MTLFCRIEIISSTPSALHTAHTVHIHIGFMTMHHELGNTIFQRGKMPLVVVLMQVLVGALLVAFVPHVCLVLWELVPYGKQIDSEHTILLLCDQYNVTSQ